MFKNIRNTIITKNTDRVLLGFIVFYAFCVSWFAFTHYPIGQTRSMEYDFFNRYAVNAAQIIKSGILALTEYDYNPPLYADLLALMAGIPENIFTAAKIISIGASVSTLVCIYFLVRALFDAHLALYTVLATATNTYFLLHSYYVGTDMMFMALSYLAITILVTQKPSHRISILLGFIVGLVYLTRYNGIFLLPVCIVALAAGRLSRGNVLCYCLSFLTTILPWHLFLFVKEGSFFFSGNHLNMAKDLLHPDENNDTFWTLIAPQYESLKDVVLANPQKFFAGILSNPGSHIEKISQDIVPQHMGILVVLGIAFLCASLAISGENRRPQGIYLGSVLTYFILMCLIHFEARYFLYIIPFLSLALIYAPYQILKWIPKMRLKAAIQSILIIGIVLYASWESVAFQRNYAKTFNAEIVRIGNFMSFFTAPDDRILARSRNIAYFSATDYQYLPPIQNEIEISKYAERHGSRFIFFSAPEATIRSYYSRFLREQISIPGFRKILRWNPLSRQSVMYGRISEKASNAWMAFNRSNFETEQVWQKLMKGVSGSGEPLLTIEGLLFITQPGDYSFAFSGDRHKLFIEDKLILKAAQASFSVNTVNLQSGFHLLRLEFQAGPDSVIPPGLFWENSERDKGPIPRSNLIITDVISPDSRKIQVHP